MRIQSALFVLLASLMVMSGLASAKAHASEPVIDTQLSNPALDEDSAMALAETGTFVQSSYDLCDPYNPAHLPNYTVPDYHPDAGVTLPMDEYDPIPGAYPTGETKFPVAVIVHGGGGWRGCRTEVGDTSWELAIDPLDDYSQHYIVFAPEYRLACKSSDPNLHGETDSPILPYCDWPYQLTDPYQKLDMYNLTNGPAIHDIEWAINYAKAHANDRCQCWNNKTVLIGGSYGGGIGFMSSFRLGTQDTANQVDAIASWSAPLEMQLQQNGKWPCDPGETKIGLEDWCRKSADYYLGCPGLPYPHPACQSPVNYFVQASPYNQFGEVNAAGWPERVWFSNGGAGTSGPEQQSWQSNDDFAHAWLRTVPGWSDIGDNANFRFCEVQTDTHSQSYIHTKQCLTYPGQSVLENMVSFLQPALVP